MRYLLSTTALFLLATTSSVAEPVAKGLAVHEWGIFTAHNDVDVANAAVRAEWDAMPEFFYGRIKGRVVPVNWGATEIRKRPIIFFYSDKPVDLRVRVSFPGGQPGLWWPGTRIPAAQGTAQPEKTNFLEWHLGVGRPPGAYRPREIDRSVPKGHWVETLRAVKCADLFAVYGDNVLDCDTEKFIFYDGIFPQGKWVKVQVAKEAVSLANLTAHAVFDVTVVDRRAAGKVRIGRIAKLEPGAEVKSVEFANADPGKFVAEACETLAKQLVAAGLNADEANALVMFRKQDFFGTAGVQVFYRIPQEEYDRRLPLAIVPAPEKTVRVGLILHPHSEPDLAERVLAIVKGLDAEDFAAREAATAKLIEMGPAAFVHLKRLQKTALNAEVRDRVNRVLERMEAAKAFPEK